MFQSYVQGQSCPTQGVYAAISMVCSCASWTLHGAQNAITESLVENAMRVLSSIMMEVPDTLAVGTLLLMVRNCVKRHVVEHKLKQGSLDDLS